MSITLESIEIYREANKRINMPTIVTIDMSKGIEYVKSYIMEELSKIGINSDNNKTKIFIFRPVYSIDIRIHSDLLNGFSMQVNTDNLDRISFNINDNGNSNKVSLQSLFSLCKLNGSYRSSNTILKEYLIDYYDNFEGIYIDQYSSNISNDGVLNIRYIFKD